MKFLLSTVLLHLALSLFSQTPKLVKKWETEALLKTPESIIYDPETKLVYVANINGNPLDKDGNGSIGKIDLSGKVIESEWITGLDAPKGMGIFKGRLYVSDINKVTIIDIKSSKIVQSIEIAGAQFLNDISIDANGLVYISDSNTKKIHTLKDWISNVWIENSAFQSPNGLLAQANSIKMVDMGSGKFYDISYADKKVTEAASGLTGGDGIVQIQKDEYLVSNWFGQVFYLKGTNVITLLDTKEQKLNAADIWYLPSQNLLLVPTFFGNTIAAYSFEK